MFCKKCGAENPDNVQFCAKCGTPTSWQPVPQQSPQPPNQPQGYQTPPPGYQAPPPGYQGAPYAMGQPQIPNYLVWSIINIFLCMILGIIATIKSSEVNTKLAQGDYAGAEAASNTAKTLNIVGTILGSIGCLGWIAYMIAIAAAVSSQMR